SVRRRGQRQRVAHAGIVGHRPDAHRESDGDLAARRARAVVAGGGVVAWRRGAGRPRSGRRHDARGTCRSDSIPGVAVSDPRGANMCKAKQWLSAALVAMAPWTVVAQVPGDLGQRLAEGYARPAVAKLTERAGQLEQALKAWCGSGGQSDVKGVQQAFAGAAQAWAGVEFLRFGPLVQGNRYEKLAFWPDTRGVMQRQVRALLAAADPAAIAPGALASRSVAMQGLPA